MENVTLQNSDPPKAAHKNRLREYREARGMSQVDLAKYLGIAQSCISEAENKYDKAIGSDAWDRLADLFDVDPRVLKGRKNL
jgi:transcriptional regulator with XRE-family HTH domain